MALPNYEKNYNATNDSGWKKATLEAGVSEGSGLGGTKGIKYKKIGTHVYIRGSVAFTWGGSSPQKLTTLPAGYIPAQSFYRFVPLTGANIARVYVTSSGIVYCEWVKKLTDGSNVTTNLSWLEIDLDFFTDLS